jgi:hypothetical protein
MKPAPAKPHEAVASAIRETLTSPHESDGNLKPANVVDGLFAIRALRELADAVRQHEGE